MTSKVKFQLRVNKEIDALYGRLIFYRCEVIFSNHHAFDFGPRCETVREAQFYVKEMRKALKWLQKQT